VGIDLHNGYDDLRQHLGHRVVVAEYGGGDNVALECEDCAEVLVDFDRTTPPVLPAAVNLAKKVQNWVDFDGYIDDAADLAEEVRNTAARFEQALDKLPDRLPRDTDENGKAEPVNLRDYVRWHLQLHGLLAFPGDDDT
jgi:hypothetical protein